MKIIGVIPCRYLSSRFPGKPLVLIDDKPMMWHVYQRCIESSVFTDIFIASDDQRIIEVGKSLGLKMLMTSKSHRTGTDRVAEVIDLVEGDYFVNVQGDEPLIDAGAIEAVAEEIINCKETDVLASNAYAPIDNCADVINTNIVKVIMDLECNALAYSRAPIPYPQSGYSKYYRQLGLYGFKRTGLGLFNTHQPLILEETEGVEMYRLLENGYKVRMIETEDKSISVDTTYDLERVRKQYEKIHG